LASLAKLEGALPMSESPTSETPTAASEHVYTQRYRTEASEAAVGFVDCIVHQGAPSEFVARVKQGSKSFASLPEAEAWFEKRNGSGSKVIKG